MMQVGSIMHSASLRSQDYEESYRIKLGQKPVPYMSSNATLCNALPLSISRRVPTSRYAPSPLLRQQTPYTPSYQS